MPLKSAIGEVINQRDLTQDQARLAMDIIMDGAATPAQIGSYLTALRIKGETVDEIAGSAASMRRHVISVQIPISATGGILLDTCGTGGDGKHTFNISTTAAFVVAGHGIKVAKHGNRAASSKSGPSGPRERRILATSVPIERGRSLLRKDSISVGYRPRCSSRSAGIVLSNVTIVPTACLGHVRKQLRRPHSSHHAPP